MRRLAVVVLVLAACVPVRLATSATGPDGRGHATAHLAAQETSRVLCGAGEPVAMHAWVAGRALPGCRRSGK